MTNLNNELQKETIEYSCLQGFINNIHSGQNNLPEQFVNQILDNSRKMSIFRQYAQNITISGEKYMYINSNPMKAHWHYEPEIIANKKYKMDFIDIYVHKLSTIFYLDNSCIDVHKTNLALWLSDRIENDLVKTENQGFLFGDGNQKPFGILHENNKNLKRVKINITENIENAIKTMIQASMELSEIARSRAIWLVSRVFYNFLEANDTRRITYGPFSDKLHHSFFLDRPIFLCEELKDKNHCLLVDLKSAYCIVDNKNMKIIKDYMSLKPHFEIYFERQVGGRPLNENSSVLFYS